MPFTTIYIGPYVAVRQPECPPFTAGHKTLSGSAFSWSILWKVLGQAVASLHPVALRRASRPLFILEIAALGGLGLIAALLLAGADAAVWGGLVLAEASLGSVVFLAGLSAAWKWHCRERDSVVAAHACQSLAYRFIDYRAPVFDPGRHARLEFGGLRDLASDIALEAVPVENLLTGNVILIESGQRIPADGTILEGIALVDESIVTGQSDPVIRESSRVSYVMRGTEVVAGRLIVEVAPQRGHPLDWHTAAPNEIVQSPRSKVQSR